MLYVIYFIVTRHLYYQQKIGLLLWFWRKSILECTEYSISPNFFRGEPLSPLPIVKGYYCLSVTITTPQTALPPSSNATAMASQCIYKPSQVSCCLLFVRGLLLCSLPDMGSIPHQIYQFYFFLPTTFYHE